MDSGICKRRRLRRAIEWVRSRIGALFLTGVRGRIGFAYTVRRVCGLLTDEAGHERRYERAGLMVDDVSGWVVRREALLGGAAGVFVGVLGGCLAHCHNQPRLSHCFA